MIKTKAKQGIQFILFLSLGIVLLWYTTSTLSDEDIKKVKELVFKADLFYIIPSIGALLLSHYIRSIRWKMMLDELGTKPSLTNVFLSVLVGYFLNLVFPRLGEVAKCSLLGKYEKMPVDKLIGTIVAERILDLVCLFIVIALTIMSQLDQLGSYAAELMDKLVGNANQSIITLVIFITGFLILLSTAFWFFRKSKWLKRLQAFFLGLKEGLFVIRKIEKKRMFLVYTLLIWFLYLLSIRIGFYSMTDTISLSWIPSLTILTFGSFAMIATQGGVGAYQLAIQKTLSFYQINEVSGLAFGWLLWSVQTFMLLVVGPIAMFLLFFLNRKKV
jgi:uncharacterized protein (TIRG00374 family)